MTTPQTVRSFPKLGLFFKESVAATATYELLPPQRFAQKFPPEFLAMYLAPDEYATLRSTILRVACGMSDDVAGMLNVATVTNILEGVLARDPDRYAKLRGEISHVQLAEMTPIPTLVEYLFGVNPGEDPWWRQHWQQRVDPEAPSAKALVAILDAVNGILTPSQQLPVIRPVLTRQLDETTLRTILDHALQTEHAYARLPEGGLSAAVKQFAGNNVLVAQIHPDEILKIIKTAIGTYADIPDMLIGTRSTTLTPPRADLPSDPDEPARTGDESYVVPEGGSRPVGRDPADIEEGVAIIAGAALRRPTTVSDESNE